VQGLAGNLNGLHHYCQQLNLELLAALLTNSVSRGRIRPVCCLLQHPLPATTRAPTCSLLLLHRQCVQQLRQLSAVLRHFLKHGVIQCCGGMAFEAQCTQLPPTQENRHSLRPGMCRLV
jgi:hypothetical protein